MNKFSAFYIHGFGSKVDPNGSKQVALREICNVSACAPDYAQTYKQVLQDVMPFASGADILIGTSMGGFMVSRLSELTGKPFVAINPVLSPEKTLRKYLGTHEDYYGRTFTITPEIAASYPVFLPARQGIVLLDMGDEVIDSEGTYRVLKSEMPVHTFEGGNHRFLHMREAIPLISDLVRARCV